MTSLSSMLRRSRLIPAVLLAAALGFGQSAAAERPGSSGETYPYATLRAEAATEVARDTVRVTLAAEVSDTSQAAVASALTAALDGVMKQARGREGVKAYSGNYHVWPMNDKDGRISNWRGRAEIILESSDFEAVSRLAAEVEDRMPIAGMSFFVAPRARAKYEADLLQEAAHAFRARAEALAKAFGYESYSIRELRIGGAGTAYQPEGRRMMAMAADAAAAVPMEGGTERISLSVEGSIFLHSKE